MELGGAVSIGVHKRVFTPGTAEYQGCRGENGHGVVYTTADFIEALRRIVRQLAAPVALIYVATDDAHAEAEFRASEFGGLVRVRQGVQRVAGGLNDDGTLNEVHIKSPHNPRCTVEDAVDVVADAMLLARCGHVLHMDSNVSTAVGLINPSAKMLHMVDVLGGPGAVPYDV